MHIRLFVIAVALTVCCLLQCVQASPLLPPFKSGASSITKRQKVNTSQEDQVSYRSHFQYAADAYCPGLQAGQKIGDDGTIIWKTGNGDDVQVVYVAYSRTLGIVVGYEGTNVSSASSIANDLRFFLDPPRPGLEWIGSEARIARAVQEAWAETTAQVLAQVQIALTYYPNADIVTTGHSFGASIALLDGLSLSRNLQRDVSVILFGLPRTGNVQFADAVEKYLPRQRHIIHFRDPIPHLPPHGLGFEHPAGEVFIADEEGQSVYDCQGRENPDCSYGLLLYRLSDHDGPYFGQPMSCQRLAVPA